MRHLPIGKAVLGCSVEVLDENMNPVAPGQIGEICIMGGGVSQGYIGNREKENQNFVTFPTGNAFTAAATWGICCQTVIWLSCTERISR